MPSESTCKLKILNPVRKDLREKHILLGLQTRRPEVDTALNLMNLQPKIGIQNEAKVLGVKNNELRAFYRKIESERSKCGHYFEKYKLILVLYIK